MVVLFKESDEARVRAGRCGFGWFESFNTASSKPMRGACDSRVDVLLCDSLDLIPKFELYNIDSVTR